MNIVVNSTPLISLSIINQLDLLRLIFDYVYIPVAVHNEVIIKGEGKNGHTELLSADWIQVINIKNTSMKQAMLARLDEGEAEVIALANELKIERVCIDEIAGRRYACFMGLDTIGTLGILLIAKKRGFVDEVKPLMDKLIDNHIYIDKRLYQDILIRAGEL